MNELRARYQRSSWAIVSGESGFMGVYRMDHMQTLAPWHSGLTVALFRSRSAARVHLPRVKGPLARGRYPHARVVRVDVKVLER